jgi:membrane protein implicated in regulation of membrane protease activity
LLRVLLVLLHSDLPHCDLPGLLFSGAVLLLTPLMLLILLPFGLLLLLFLILRLILLLLACGSRSCPTQKQKRR